MNCNSALYTRSVKNFFQKNQKELVTGRIITLVRILLSWSVLMVLLNGGLLKAQNPIVSENALPGNPKSEWDVTLAGDLSIQGFATDMSVNKGATIRFKINVDGGVNYNIKIYRLGYYQGLGARLITDLGSFTGQQQPNPVSNTQTGLVDCGNWAESASWPVPSTAVSGVYLAKLTRADNGGASHIVFVVRDDARNAGLLFKTSDATWQAYNVYGGNSFYTGSTSYPSGHAVKISYNRPFITRGGGGGGDAMMDWLFNAEYPMIRWLERNGYDVAYTTDVDMDRDPTPITPSKHKALLSVGHDEYWSGAQRAKFEAARDAGVSLAFFSGNEVYWKTRWETSVDGNNTHHRTLVCYKEGDVGENVCGGKCDPLPNVWTGLWRDGCSFSADGCQPENALTGQISWTESTGSIRVPDTFKSLPIWRNTSVASLLAGQSVTFPNGTLGYEWDAVEPEYASSNPPGRQVISRTTLDGKTHEMSLYQHPSGA
ncbi:MAG TPA: N,N-dimethylformamidase beta subunit family domain-containing protein, partial [Sphingobacteriaceae bacterium]